MKKIISLMLIVALIFSFSACGDNSKVEEEVPVIRLPLVEIADAYLSGNGAVYQDCINDIQAKKISYTVKVSSVEDITTIYCSSAYTELHLINRGIEMGSIKLHTEYEQSELLKTLKNGDEIEFEGKLGTVFIHDTLYGVSVPPVMTVDCNHVVIKSVNGTAVQ